MKKQLYAVFFLLVTTISLNAQNCDPSTPVFNIDLTGQPNGTWISTPVQRDGLCCSSSSPDNCVQFNVTLDTAARGIAFNIYSGAMPGGSMFYQINCGPPQAVGQPVCLTGAGPHIITFCKPGNNTNEYSISSIGDPSLNGTRYVSQSCQGQMVVTGLVLNTIQWTSVPNNPVYDAYLSCTSGCDSVGITPPFNSSLPFIDYQVCGTIVGGCATSTFCDTIRVNFVNNLSVEISPDDPTICFGGTNAILTATGSGGLQPYAYLWSTGETSATINVGPGTYFVRVSDQMNCSWEYDTVIVSALASAIDANAGPDATLCRNDQAYQLNGSIIAAAGGLWTGQGSFSPSATTLNALYYPTATEIANGYADLQLVSTGNYNCPADSDSIHIVIIANPVPNISGPGQICLDAIAQYSTSFVPGNNYLWAITGGTILTANQNSVTVKWTTAGNQQLSVIEINGAGCDSIASIPVVVMPKPMPQITGVQQVCNLSTESYNIVNPVSLNTYSWTVSNGILFNSTGSAITISWNIAGAGQITVVETNTDGCDSSVSIPVSVLGQPTPVITGLNSICSRQFASYSVAHDTSFTYNWSVTGGNILSQSGSSIEVFWTTQGTGTIMLNVINQGMCDSAVSIPVTLLPQPAPIINGPNRMCTFVPVDYHVTGIQAGDSLSWSLSGGIIQGNSNNDTVRVLWQSGTLGEIRINVMNSAGCDSSTSRLIILMEGAAPTMQGPLSSCLHDSCVYSVAAVQGHSYQWQIIGGSIVGTESNSIIVYWLTEGTGVVTVTEMTSYGCDSTVMMSVDVNPLPVPAMSGGPMICQNESSLFSTPFVANNYYFWLLSGGSVIGSNLEPTVTCLWQDTGNYVVSLIELNPYGCMSAVDVQVQVLSRPNINITSDLTGCVNRNSQITVVQEPNVTYQYAITGGSMVSNFSGIIEVDWNSIGSNAIAVYAVNNSSGCNAQNTINVFVDPLPRPVINANSFAGCPPLNVSFQNNTDSSAYHYLWNFGEGSISTDGNPAHSFNESGHFNVNVFVSNNTGCVDSAQATINVFPRPVSDFNILNSNSIVYSEIQDVILHNTSQGAITYSWHLGNGDSSTAFEPIIRYNQPGLYNINLETRNIYGCRSLRVKTVEVIVPENIFVPNAFTPNGDAINDFFSVGYNNITSASISIFNRWGQKIFESDDMNFKWDGDYKSIKVLHEVYVYKINAIGFHGTKLDKMGTLTVIY